jgi:hypothetical protein
MPKDRPFIASSRPPASSTLNLAARTVGIAGVAPGATWRERFWVKASGY